MCWLDSSCFACLLLLLLLQEWLNQNIHAKGSLYTSGDELMAAVTGNALQPQTFLKYLRGKYGKLYSLGGSTAEQK